MIRHRDKIGRGPNEVEKIKYWRIDGAHAFWQLADKRSIWMGMKFLLWILEIAYYTYQLLLMKIRKMYKTLLCLLIIVINSVWNDFSIGKILNILVECKVIYVRREFFLLQGFSADLLDLVWNKKSAQNFEKSCNQFLIELIVSER